MKKLSIHWFRRDLRLEDNPALNAALNTGQPVLCIFIFDKMILEGLPRDDARVSFIHSRLTVIHEQLRARGSGLKVLHAEPVYAWRSLLNDLDIASVHFNADYEPYALNRDKQVKEVLDSHNVSCIRYQDHVLIEPGNLLKTDGKPYTVYTPFKNKFRIQLAEREIPSPVALASGEFVQYEGGVPALEDLGFQRSDISVPEFAPEHISEYDRHRDDPAAQRTTYVGTHLRFGSLSIRQVASLASNETYLNELIWREFFIHILYHFPHVVNGNFRAKYDGVEWRNNTEEFEKWCTGRTGYPIVDAGMRQLNATGYMHNRVRMITAGFLCKHLLIDWRWGEAYFAQKLLDFELASNNGNWQWAAGTGCDAAPYFRVFNPITQLKKFDKDLRYAQRWVEELDSGSYPEPMVEHKFARERALARYKEGIEAK